MGNAKRDENSVPTLLGVSSADGITPVAIYVDPITHRMLTQASASPGGSDTQVQFNDGGSLGGDAGFTYNKTTNIGTIGGLVISASDGVVPSANDGSALGSASASFSDLFLASGALINFANGNAIITHSSGILTVSTGDLRVTTAGTNAASVVTVGGTQTLTNKTLTSPTIGTSPTAAGATWTDLGTVTTVDINGGTIDGSVIGGSSAATVTGTTITANTGFMPDANDGAYLGQSGTAFSDLFLASGALIDFAAGNAVITHSSGIITVSTGELRITTVGTNSASVPTLGSTSTLTNKTLTAPKIADAGFIADANGNEQIIFNTTASAVNEIAITNAATGTTGPLIAASGETNVDIRLSGKGTGAVHIISGSYGDITADSDGATITFNLATSNIHSVTLGGNRTLALSNAHVGQCFMLRLLQDGTGSRTVTWFSTIKWAGGAAPTLTTTANKADLIGFIVTSSGNYDGFVVGQNI